MARRDGKDSFIRPDGTIETGFDCETGRYGLILTGPDSRGRFCRQEGTARGNFLDGTGRESATGDVFSAGGDGGVHCRWNCRRDWTMVPFRRRFYRPVPSSPSIPSRQENHEKPWEICCTNVRNPIYSSEPKDFQGRSRDVGEAAGMNVDRVFWSRSCS